MEYRAQLWTADVDSQWNGISMAYERSLDDLYDIDMVSDKKNENAVERLRVEPVWTWP